ncbi:hypothetical protein GCM10017688_02480 [Streptomyces ramulosus]
MDSGPVAVGKFVEAGGYRAELLETAEAAFDDVAGLVKLAVEGWRRAWRIARDEYAVSASTTSGLQRGRPAPVRGTRSSPMTVSKTVESLILPGVTTTARGRPLPSQAR